jgi:phytoene/squalene synthetase
MDLSLNRLIFAVKRPWLFVRGLLVSRNQPNLSRLRRQGDPEGFVWAVLPHAARTFAPSILGLPHDRARVAAVGYLYARMLDTYEDLAASARDKIDGLEGFGARFGATPPLPPPPLRSPSIHDERDLVHLLLLERCALVDAVFAELAPNDRARIVDMLEDMSTGMQRFVTLFEEHAGVLDTESRVEEYCHTVIGHPILFTMRLLVGEAAARRFTDEALQLSVLVQLANVTRDIEKDAIRGIGYHPALQVGDAVVDPDVVAAVRADLVRRALRHVPVYAKLVDDLALPRISLARGSAVLMALHTDRHYRRMARKTGMRGWAGVDSAPGIWMTAIIAIVSSRWTARVLGRIEAATASAVTPQLAATG